MSWSSPTVERRFVPDEGDERTLLNAFLEFHRETFLWKCSGLTGEQLATRSVSSTDMTLLGLIRHLTDVERHWLRDVAVGESIESRYWDKPDRDSDFLHIDAAAAEADYVAYIEEVEICRENQGIDLDATIDAPNGRDRFTFRWILIHLIEEYARHNGHADLIREAIDGATGE
ncbi:MAG TPA: DinB family protein [Actinomycetes bacterium]|nr:DinB family protein [Actinomycetes bacterium]